VINQSNLQVTKRLCRVELMMNGIERVDRSLSLKARKFRKDADQTWDNKSHNFIFYQK